MEIKPDEIAGYYVGEELHCSECQEAEGVPEVEKSEDILTQDEAEEEDKLYFCDRCKKRIS